MEVRPYVHSPEEGTAEADAQPWTIHVPVQPLPWTDEDAEIGADGQEEEER